MQGSCVAGFVFPRPFYFWVDRRLLFRCLVCARLVLTCMLMLFALFFMYLHAALSKANTRGGSAPGGHSGRLWSTSKWQHGYGDSFLHPPSCHPLNSGLTACLTSCISAMLHRVSSQFFRFLCYSYILMHVRKNEVWITHGNWNIVDVFVDPRH